VPGRGGVTISWTLWASAAIGAWLVVAPWLLAGYTVAGAAVGSLLGVLLILLARPAAQSKKANPAVGLFAVTVDAA